MKESLTEKEIELTTVIRDKWINLAFEKCSEGIDENLFETGIEWLYDKFLSLPKPQVVYCDSVVDALLKITLVKDFGKELSDFTPQLLSDYENDKLDAHFMSKLKENLSLKSTYIGWSNFGWVSFYDYFTEIKQIDNEDFNNYKKLIESNVFDSFKFEKVVFAVKPPVVVHYNENKISHNIAGPSVVFIDGTELYCVNGFTITKELFTSLYNKTYTVSDFFNEKNEEIKSAVISFLQSRDGDSGVYFFLKDYINEVDTYIDVKNEELMVGTIDSPNVGVYTLLKGEINNVEIAYVRCYCPSTDRIFFLGVDPIMNNAKDAIASLYQIPKILKEKLVSISRQGEKFSSTFDTETTKKLENNEFTPKELSEYTNLSGEDYFNLMTYEY
jgi:hypothetical protein